MAGLLGFAGLLASAIPVTVQAAAPQSQFLQQPIMAEATIGGAPLGHSVASGIDGFTPAPMPDVDRDAPIVQPADPDAAHLSPKLFHKQTNYQGEGYVFGSTAQGEVDRRVGPTPGINVVMPLQ